MYARNVSINLKPNSASEFTQTFEKDILPLLRKQNGFKDEITFLSRRRQGRGRHQLVGSQGERGCV